MVNLNTRNIKQKIKDRLNRFPHETRAVMGRPDGVVESTGQNVWVTLYNGDTIEVYNDRVPLRAFKKIIIGYDRPNSQLIQVLRFDEVYPNNPDPNLKNHKESHVWWGYDPIDIYYEAIVPMLPRAAGGFIVRVFPGRYKANGVRCFFPGLDVDMEPEAVTSGAEWVNAEIDEFGAVTFSHGSNFANKYLLTEADIPDPDPSKYFLFSAKMYEGLLEFVQINSDSDIYDPRFVEGSAGSGVQSVTGAVVDNTDPTNPVINADADGAAATAETNAKAYADSLVVGLWDDRGAFDASVNAYPSSGGSGTAGAIKKGDIWTISVAGTLPTAQAVEVGDTVRALIDTPGNTQGNWAIQQNNIGYVPENVANKDTSGGYVGLDVWKIKFRNAANTFTSFLVNAATAARTYTFPDRSGTIADDTDLAGKQPLDSDLTSIAGLTPSNDDIIQRKAGAWTNRTIAQLITDIIASGLSYLSLTNRPAAETNSTDVFQVLSPGGVSAFVGTIATLPGGATLTYNVTSGQEGAMNTSSTGQLAKIRLYNTTRGSYALISSCTTGTNTIVLTANVPGAWQVGDTITIASQTVSGGGFSWIDLEIVSALTGKNALMLILIFNTATAGDRMTAHPFETFAASKLKNVFAAAANINMEIPRLLKITGNVFSIAWQGSPTSVTIREEGYLE